MKLDVLSEYNFDFLLPFPIFDGLIFLPLYITGYINTWRRMTNDVATLLYLLAVSRLFDFRAPFFSYINCRLLECTRLRLVILCDVTYSCSFIRLTSEVRLPWTKPVSGTCRHPSLVFAKGVIYLNPFICRTQLRMYIVW
jgi:hypothetical protein